MRDIDGMKAKFLKGYEFSIVILTSVPEYPMVEKSQIPNDERLQNKNLTELFREETIPGILKNAAGEDYEIVIVDNGSCLQHIKAIAEVVDQHKPTRIVLNGENFGVAPGWNSGMKLCRGKYVCIVSDDFIVGTPNFLRILQAPMIEDRFVVITGPESAQLGSDAMCRQPWRLPYVDYCAINCCMFRHSFLHKVGYLDEFFWPYMGEDADIGWTANTHGYKVVKTSLPGSTHWGSSSVYRYWTTADIDEMWKTNKEYMINKHKKYLDARVKQDERYA